MFSRPSRLPLQTHHGTQLPLPSSPSIFEETSLDVVPAGHMNVSQFNSRAPKTQNSSEGAESTRASSDSNLDEITPHVPTSPTLIDPFHRASHIPTSISSTQPTILIPPNTAKTSIEISSTSNTARWSSHDHLELQYAGDLHPALGTKRTSSKISPHLSTATGPPPTKKQHCDRRKYNLELDSRVLAAWQVVGLLKKCLDDEKHSVLVILHREKKK